MKKKKPYSARLRWQVTERLCDGEKPETFLCRNFDEQWEIVENFREDLAQCEESSGRSHMEECWRLLESHDAVFPRGDVRVADNPLAALMYYIDMGFYPPPELLLGLFETWQAYKLCGGKVSLEDAFLGRPVRKAGNYASRSRARFRNMYLRMNLEEKISNGMSKTQAAEQLSLESGIEADTIVRVAKPFRRSKKRKINRVNNPRKLPN